MPAYASSACAFWPASAPAWTALPSSPSSKATPRNRKRQHDMNAQTNLKPKADMADKLVYNFGDGTAEGKADMKNLLGGKGANLAEMCSLGLPVPPGFTITTEVC